MHSTRVISIFLLIAGILGVVLGLILFRLNITDLSSVLILVGILVLLAAIMVLVVSFDYSRAPLAQQVQSDLNNGNVDSVLNS